MLHKEEEEETFTGGHPLRTTVYHDVTGWSMLHKEEEEERFTGAAPTEDNCMS